jgi:hypothetical protein
MRNFLSASICAILAGAVLLSSMDVASAQQRVPHTAAADGSVIPFSACTVGEHRCPTIAGILKTRGYSTALSAQVLLKASSLKF